MDRVIEQKRWSGRRLWLLSGALAALALLAVTVLATPDAGTLRLAPERLTVATAERGEFFEYVPVIGNVVPVRTVHLDAVEGGRVEEILVEDGRHIEAGQAILRLSNAALQKEAIGTESALLENMNALRNTRINLAEKALLLREQLLDTEYRIGQLEKQMVRYRTLRAEGGLALSARDFETAEDELAYLLGKREIIRARIEQERALREQQLAHVDATIERVDRNLVIVGQTLDQLDVRAPISGQLSALRVEVGQNVQRGENLGHIDVLDDFKVRARIDQHYIARVTVGQRGDTSLAGHRYSLEVVKIYPGVEDDLFVADLAFVGGAPEDVKRGQSVRVDLSLSAVESALLLDRGGFYRSTGGRWAYVVRPDGSGAERREVQLGRQSPRHLEVLAGLEAGERVITSSYDNFMSATTIEFSQPLAGAR